MSYNETEHTESNHDRLEQINDESGIEWAWSRVLGSDGMGFVIDKNDGRVSRYRSNGDDLILKEVELGEINRRLTKRDLRMVLDTSYDIYMTSVEE